MNTTSSGRPRPFVLIVMDGWGMNPRQEGKAIALAHTPNIDMIASQWPHTAIKTSGTAVGLPEGQMGNSEVGHQNIGAGKRVLQDYTRVSASIADDSFFQNAALLRLAQVHGVERVNVHSFTDGRDTSPTGGIATMKLLQARAREIGGEHAAKVASVSGRYYAMDRDNRWDRTGITYATMTRGGGQLANSAVAAIQQSYDKAITDEFILPTVVMEDTHPVAVVQAGDALIHYNFRPDRARQLSKAFVMKELPPQAEGKFRRGPQLEDLAFVMMTAYEEGLNAAVAYRADVVEMPIVRVISDDGLRQFHTAETEKYAHVTYFINGRRETPFPGEDRLLVPSPKVPTYDLQPEMSAAGITDTGIGRVVEATLAVGGGLLITADHGNAEQLLYYDTGKPFTAHTTYPVPLYLVVPRLSHARLRADGILADVAPTIVQVLGDSTTTGYDGKLVDCVVICIISIHPL